MRTTRNPNTAKGYTTNDKDMNFKQPIASNQETKNWVTKETKFKTRNQELSQVGKQKKSRNKNENQENRDPIVTLKAIAKLRVNLDKGIIIIIVMVVVFGLVFLHARHVHH